MPVADGQDGSHQDGGATPHQFRKTRSCTGRRVLELSDSGRSWCICTSGETPGCTNKDQGPEPPRRRLRVGMELDPAFQTQGCGVQVAVAVAVETPSVQA